MKPEKLLTIAIPTFKNVRQLIDCLWTLTNYTEFSFNIYVVNNGPEFDLDGISVEKFVRSHITYPDLHWLQMAGNMGWQKAINYAFETAEETPYFCMANDDLLFLPGHKHFWWQLMAAFQWDDVAAVGPASNFVMGSQSIFDHRGGAGIYETTLLIGFLMVVRSKAFAEVGGLDDALVGGDDLDLSILLRERGYRLICNRNVYVHHIGAQTGARLYSWWNTAPFVESTNNALIRKHGVRAWYDTIESRIRPFVEVTQTTDAEGDLIRQRIGHDKCGIDVGCGGNKTLDGSIGIDRDQRGTIGAAGGRKLSRCQADLVSDAADLPFADQTQDYIIARHLIEHLVDPLPALLEWHRVLKDDGVLAVACPDEDRTNTMLLDWTHKHAWNPSALEKIVSIAGFDLLSSHLVDPGMSFVQFYEKRENGKGFRWH